MLRALLLISVIITSYTSNAYKALVIVNLPSRSHAILNDVMVKQLLKEGNEVTYISWIPYENPPPNLRQIDVGSNSQALPERQVKINTIINKAVIVNDQFQIRHKMFEYCLKIVENKDVQKLLNNTEENFDVVLAQFKDVDLLASFAAVFDCPLIWLSPIEANSDILRRIDGIPNPAYMPDAMSMNIAPLTFIQRLEELWSMIKLQYLYYRYLDDIQIEAYNRLIAPSIVKRGRKPPSLYDIQYNVSLVLGYSDVSWGEAVALPPNYKSVGGYHIDEENIAPLPEDLKIILDNATDGVIFFSMGTNLRSKEWPKETRKNLLKMLGKLNQTVLWKYEEKFPSTPKNVYISNWFPQQSILSHPNCVLFITHGGLLSTAEAIHFGVPIIGIPVFGDQYVNAKRAALKGFGLTVGLTSNIVKDLKIAIKEIISNPSFKNKAKEFSLIYHDRPIKPIMELSHWVRHVVRTQGARHLRSPGLHLALYQRLYLDLFALISVILIFFLLFIFVSYRVMYGIWLKMSMKKEKRNKNKQIIKMKKEY